MIEPVVLILLTEAGIVLSHIWAREDHTHYAHRPFVRGLAIANWFHVASWCSHYPAVIGLLYLSGAPWWLWIVTAVLSSAVWAIAKRATGKAWPMGVFIE